MTLIDFAHNNSFHSSIGMPSYEALYGRKCGTHMCWLEMGEKKFTRPKLVRITNEKIKIVQTHMKAAQDRQRSCANLKKRHFKMNPDDLFMLEISHWK